METVVVIVGAGPAGIATSACLNQSSIPNIVLERDDCCGSLWKKRAYDRVSLHLAKEFCELPHKPHSSSTPKFMPKDVFIKYLDDYVSQFDVKPHYFRSVESAFYDETMRRWKVEAENLLTGETEVYIAKYLVVASGENGKGIIPKVPGLEDFIGEVVHACDYKSGLRYKDQDVLVIGCGNSGMEISYDLSNYGARASMVVRGPIHILTRELVYLGMSLAKYTPIDIVDDLILTHQKQVIGDLSMFGIQPHTNGPFQFKMMTGRTPVIDVGTVEKIRSGEIKVVPEVVSVRGNKVMFEDNSTAHFDAIILATGYESTANEWLKDHKFLLNDKGMPRNKYPNHWKGDNRVYCVGFAGKGLQGISEDAKATADDIKNILEIK